MSYILSGYNKQSFASDRLPFPVDVLADTSKTTAVTGETVQLKYFANAYLTCGTAGSSTYTDWVALGTSTKFQIGLNGADYIINPDFSAATDMDGVATAIQTALQTYVSSATCVWSTDHFVITTAMGTTDNNVSVLSNPTANTGADVAGASWINGKYGTGVVTPATLTNDAGQAAGTVVMAKLTYSGILDQLGAMIGNEHDTSLTWTTGTVLPMKYQKQCPKSHIENASYARLVQMALKVTQNFATGEWCLDHRNGVIFGKKATTGTSDTAAYSVATSETTSGGLLADVNLKQIAGTAATAITQDAAFGTAAVGLPFFGKYQATPTTYTDGDACPILLDANGRVVLSSDIEIGAVELKDAAADTRASIIAANTAAIGYYLGVQPARYLATPPSLTDTYSSPLLLGSKNELLVNIFDGTNSLGLLTQDSAFGTTSKGFAVFGKYEATPTTYTDGDACPILLDANGRIVLSSDIEIGAVELKNGADDTRATIDAANTARTVATTTLVTQPIDAAGNVLGRDAANTARTTATLVDPSQIIDAAGNVFNINAANTARTTGTLVLPVQNIGADGTVAPTGSANTNAPFVKLTDGTTDLLFLTGTVKTGPATINDGTTSVVVETDGTKKALNVNVTDGTNDMPTMDANTRAGFFQVTDGTNEVDIIGTINSLKSDISSVGGEVVVADNGAGAAVTKTIPVGGKYNATPPTYTDGDVAMSQYDINGNLKVAMASDIEIGAVELKNGADDTRATIDAANTARTVATTTVVTQPIDASGNVFGREAANTARTTATLVDPVQVIDAAGNVINITAANTARTTGTLVLPVQNIGADGTVAPTGSANTNAPFVKLTDGTTDLLFLTGTVKTVPATINDGTTSVVVETDGTKKALNVNITDGTNDMPTMDANTRAGFFQVTDGTNEVDVIATVNSLKSDVSSIGGEVVVADNGAGAAVTKTLPVGGKYNATPPTYTDGDVAMTQFDINGNLKTTATADTPTTLTGGSKTVAVPGTAEALGASLATKSIYIRAKSGNTTAVYVGDSSVDKDTNQQIILFANDSITLDISNRATVYIDAVTAAEGVDFVCMS